MPTLLMVACSPSGFGGPAKTFYPPGHMPPDRLAKWERQIRENYTAKAMPGDPPLMGTPEHGC